MSFMSFVVPVVSFGLSFMSFVVLAVSLSPPPSTAIMYMDIQATSSLLDYLLPPSTLNPQFAFSQGQNAVSLIKNAVDGRNIASANAIMSMNIQATSSILDYLLPPSPLNSMLTGNIYSIQLHSRTAYNFE